MLKPALAITMGDVNGIGPEILAKALSHPEMWAICRPVVIGSADVLNAMRVFAKTCPPAVARSEWSGRPGSEDITVLEADMQPYPLDPGKVSAAAGKCAVEWLKKAVDIALSGEVDGIVTCPINKKGINMAGYTYTGHTEVIAERTNSPEVRMCLFAERMRIVHISAHCPFTEVQQYVKSDRIAASIRIAEKALRQLNLPRRRIAVAGLNPHAGEEGILGYEDAQEVMPAILVCQSEGIDCTGPYPPDTVFRRMMMGEFDLVVAMYHDQGHVPFKLVAMDEGVNVTLNIPIVRTSVDHGTAYDIAGRGVASETSLCAAIRLAARFAASRKPADIRREERP